MGHDPPDKEDEQWLSALAGQSDPGADPKLNLQAEALRRALQARSAMLEAKVPTADTAQYQQLMFRLRREGLASGRSAGGNPMRWRLAAKRVASAVLDAEWSSPMLWGLAGTVVLGVGVVIQMGGLHQDQDDANTLRGGGQSTILIVTEPEVRLAELLAGLRAAGEEPTVKREADGRIVLTVKGTEKVLEYLAAQRIEPTLDKDTLTIELRAVKSPK